MNTLIGDIGGTNTRLALLHATNAKILRQEVLPSSSAASLEELVARFLGPQPPRINKAVLGVAGPVQGGIATITNLPWKLSEARLSKALGGAKVRLLNDLVIAAYGCLACKGRDLKSLAAGLPKHKGDGLAVIAAGTGLGEARLAWTGETYIALSSEGGHSDFAPRSPLEIELLHFLSERYPDHVSYERVVCGAGLGLLYDFFVARAGRESQSAQRKLREEGDRNAIIARLGLAKDSRAAAQAVDMFASLYGAEAGNLVLREAAWGGLYVVGNIAQHIIRAKTGPFLAAFRQKGRFSERMATVPVALVTAKDIGLAGAIRASLSLR